MNVFELFGNLSLKGVDKVNTQLSQLEKNTQKVQKGLKVAGAAFTAMGVAGLAIIQSTKKINAQLGVTAINLGLTTKEMRKLTLETTNVTFPIKEVTATFDLLARAGVKDQKVLKDTATAFDTLGDAIGVPAGLVTAQLIPAMKTFNISAGEMAGKTDALTWLFRNTTVNLEDFNRMVGYTTPELVEMGLTTEDMIAILAELEEQGYSGEVMTREFRKAVTLATKEQIPLNEALGITTETIEGYKVEMEGATGLTQQYADVANEQYTIMDKLKQKWSELTLSASGFLEPMEPLLAGMTALGPVMLGLSRSAPMLAKGIRLLGLATKKAMGIFGVLIIALVLFAKVLMQNEKLMESLRQAFGKIMEAIAPVIEILSDLFSQIMDALRPALEMLVEAFGRIIDQVGEVLTDALIMFIEKALVPLAIMFADLVVQMMPLIEKVLPILIDAFIMLVNALMPVFEFLMKIQMAILSFVIPAFTKVVGAIISVLGPALKGLVGIVTGVKDAFIAAKDWILEKWEAVVEFFKGVVSRIGSAFGTIKDIILSPFRAAISGIETAINWLIRQMNKISFKIPSWVPFIGGKRFGIDIPEISLPSFERGGLIPEPTLLYGLKSQRPYALAGLGGVESVVPGSGAGINIYVDTMNVLDEDAPRRIAIELEDLRQEAVRAGGG